MTGTSTHKIIPLLRHVLENSSRPHASTDAHGDHSVACIAALQFADQRRGQLGTRASQGMTKSNRPAVDVYLPEIKPAFLDHRQRLRRKRLIEFDNLNIREPQ